MAAPTPPGSSALALQATSTSPAATLPMAAPLSEVQGHLAVVSGLTACGQAVHVPTTVAMCPVHVPVVVTHAVSLLEPSSACALSLAPTVMGTTTVGASWLSPTPPIIVGAVPIQPLDGGSQAFQLVRPAQDAAFPQWPSSHGLGHQAQQVQGHGQSLQVGSAMHVALAQPQPVYVWISTLSTAPTTGAFVFPVQAVWQDQSAPHLQQCQQTFLPQPDCTQPAVIQPGPQPVTSNLASQPQQQAPCPQHRLQPMHAQNVPRPAHTDVEQPPTHEAGLGQVLEQVDQHRAQAPAMAPAMEWSPAQVAPQTSQPPSPISQPVPMPTSQPAQVPQPLADALQCSQSRSPPERLMQAFVLLPEMSCAQAQPSITQPPASLPVCLTALQLQPVDSLQGHDTPQPSSPWPKAQAQPQVRQQQIQMLQPCEDFHHPLVNEQLATPLLVPQPSVYNHPTHPQPQTAMSTPRSLPHAHLESVEAQPSSPNLESLQQASQWPQVAQLSAPVTDECQQRNSPATKTRSGDLLDAPAATAHEESERSDGEGEAQSMLEDESERRLAASSVALQSQRQPPPMTEPEGGEDKDPSAARAKQLANQPATIAPPPAEASPLTSVELKPMGETVGPATGGALPCEHGSKADREAVNVEATGEEEGLCEVEADPKVCIAQIMEFLGHAPNATGREAAGEPAPLADSEPHADPVALVDSAPLADPTPLPGSTPLADSTHNAHPAHHANPAPLADPALFAGRAPLGDSAATAPAATEGLSVEPNGEVEPSPHSVTDPTIGTSAAQGSASVSGPVAKTPEPDDVQLLPSQLVTNETVPNVPVSMAIKCSSGAHGRPPLPLDGSARSDGSAGGIHARDVGAISAGPVHAMPSQTGGLHGTWVDGAQAEAEDGTQSSKHLNYEQTVRSLLNTRVMTRRGDLGTIRGLERKWVLVEIDDKGGPTEIFARELGGPTEPRSMDSQRHGVRTRANRACMPSEQPHDSIRSGAPLRKFHLSTLSDEHGHALPRFPPTRPQTRSSTPPMAPASVAASATSKVDTAKTSPLCPLESNGLVLAASSGGVEQGMQLRSESSGPNGSPATHMGATAASGVSPASAEEEKGERACVLDASIVIEAWPVPTPGVGSQASSVGVVPRSDDVAEQARVEEDAEAEESVIVDACVADVLKPGELWQSTGMHGADESLRSQNGAPRAEVVQNVVMEAREAAESGEESPVGNWIVSGAACRPDPSAREEVAMREAEHAVIVDASFARDTNALGMNATRPQEPPQPPLNDGFSGAEMSTNPFATEQGERPADDASADIDPPVGGVAARVRRLSRKAARRCTAHNQPSEEPPTRMSRSGYATAAATTSHAIVPKSHGLMDPSVIEVVAPAEDVLLLASTTGNMSYEMLSDELRAENKTASALDNTTSGRVSGLGRIASQRQLPSNEAAGHAGRSKKSARISARQASPNTSTNDAHYGAAGTMTSEQTKGRANRPAALRSNGGTSCGGSGDGIAAGAVSVFAEALVSGRTAAEANSGSEPHRKVSERLARKAVMKEALEAATNAAAQATATSVAKERQAGKRLDKRTIPTREKPASSTSAKTWPPASTGTTVTVGTERMTGAAGSAAARAVASKRSRAQPGTKAPSASVACAKSSSAGVVKRRKLARSEADDMFASRFSVLGHASLRLTPHVIGLASFSALPYEERERLAEYLPEGDRNPSQWRDALLSEQLAEAVSNWQQQLRSGEFDPSCEEVVQIRRRQQLRKAQRAASIGLERLKDAASASPQTAALLESCLHSAHSSFPTDSSSKAASGDSTTGGVLAPNHAVVGAIPAATSCSALVPYTPAPNSHADSSEASAVDDTLHDTPTRPVHATACSLSSHASPKDDALALISSAVVAATTEIDASGSSTRSKNPTECSPSIAASCEPLPTGARTEADAVGVASADGSKPTSTCSRNTDATCSGSSTKLKCGDVAPTVGMLGEQVALGSQGQSSAIVPAMSSGSHAKGTKGTWHLTHEDVVGYSPSDSEGLKRKQPKDGSIELKPDESRPQKQPYRPAPHAQSAHGPRVHAACLVQTSVTQEQAAQATQAQMASTPALAAHAPQARAAHMPHPQVAQVMPALMPQPPQVQACILETYQPSRSSPPVRQARAAAARTTALAPLSGQIIVPIAQMQQCRAQWPNMVVPLNSTPTSHPGAIPNAAGEGASPAQRSLRIVEGHLRFMDPQQRHAFLQETNLAVQSQLPHDSDSVRMASTQRAFNAHLATHEVCMPPQAPLSAQHAQLSTRMPTSTQTPACACSHPQAQLSTHYAPFAPYGPSQISGTTTSHGHDSLLNNIDR